MSALSTKPYLIRAIHEWCIDSGYRPYIAVAVDEHTVVPREFVRAGEIVLNVSPAATNRLSLGNELIEFEARFGGVARAVSIPIDNVSAIYAQETGQGMAFEVPKPLALVPEPADGVQPAGAVDPADPAQADDVGGDGAAPSLAPTPARSRRRPKLTAVPSPTEADLPAAGAAAGKSVPAAETEGDAPAKAPRRRRKPAAKAGEDAVDGSVAPALAPAAAPEGSSAAQQTGKPDDEPPAPPKGPPRLTRVK